MTKFSNAFLGASADSGGFAADSFASDLLRLQNRLGLSLTEHHPSTSNTGTESISFVSTFWGGYPVNAMWTIGDIAIPTVQAREPGSISALDVNGDGRTDFVVTDTYGLPITVLLNDGSDTFSDGTSTVFPNGAPVAENDYVQSDLIRDFNGDGRPDLYLPAGATDGSAGSSGNPDVLLLSSGAHGFVDGSSHIPQVDDTSTYGDDFAAAADINGDGSVDIFVNDGDAFGNNPHFLINNGHGVFTQGSASELPASVADDSSNTLGACTFFDANGDGSPDLFLGSSGGASLLLFNDGHGNFKETADSVISLPGIVAPYETVTGVVPLDINNDKHMDLVVAGGGATNHSDIYFLINNGTGKLTNESSSVVAWTPSGTPYSGAVSSEFRLYAVDLNNDGFTDVVGVYDNQKVVFLNDGSGHFVEMPGDIFPQSPDGSDPHAYLSAMTFGDFNGDGLTDAIAYTGNPDGDGYDHFTIFWGHTPPSTQTGNGDANAIMGSAANDTLSGGGGNDAIFSAGGNDVIDGGAGNDYLNPGSGNDKVTGDAGNDLIDMGPNLTASDSIDGGTGTDTVLLTGNYSKGLTFSATTMVNVEVLTLGAGYSYKLTTNDATVAAGQTLTVNGSALGSGNTLNFNGSAETNGSFVITGGAGNDTLVGGAGNDTIKGGAGADHLTGGAGDDQFVYGSAADSTGTAYDTVIGFDALADKFNVPGTITGINTAVTTGALSTSTLNTNLAADIGASQLGAHHAVEFTPNSGTLAGDHFLIIDVNGVAGYQANDDLVILLSSPANMTHLSTSDFI